MMNLFINASIPTDIKITKMEIFDFHRKLMFVLAVSALSSLFTQLFALQEGKLNPTTQSIDAMLYGVDINVTTYEGDAISYKAEIAGNKKVSIVEDARCVRFRNSHPVSGKITVLVPKDMKVESLRITSSSAKVNVQGVVAVYFAVSMCEGIVNMEHSMLKVASFSIASGTCQFSGEITHTADFCFSETQAHLNLKGSLSDFNFFYPYEETSSLTIDGKYVTNKDKFSIDKKKKKRMGITQSGSKTTLTFVK